MFVRHERTDRHRHRPPHPTRGVPPAARRGQRELPARIGREGSAGAALVRRLRLADRGLSTRRRPAGSRSSATSATTTSRGSSRPCHCPTRVATCPRAVSSWPTTLVRFDHGLGMAEVLCGDPGTVGGAARWAAALARPAVAGARRLDPPASLAARVRAFGRAARRSTSARATPSRSSSRSAPSDRPLRQRARALPLAAPREPVAVPLPARARRARARRLLAGDARQGRGPGRVAEPDRRDDAAGRRRRGTAALVGEGPRRARDARRPRPQRPLAGLPARDGARRAVPRAGALLARDAPRLGGRRRAGAGCLALRPAARVLPGRDGLRSAEGAGDADHLRARGVPPRALRGRGRSTRSRARRSTHASRSGRWCCTTASRCCRPAPGSSPTPTRRPSTTSACASSRRSRRRSSSRRRGM